MERLRKDYTALIKRLHDFLVQVGGKNPTNVSPDQKLLEELADKGKRLFAASSAMLELQGHSAERERELKSLQRTNALYEKRVEELQQKLARIRTENGKLLGEESTAVKLKDQVVSDLRFRILDLDKAAREGKKYSRDL